MTGKHGATGSQGSADPPEAAALQTKRDAQRKADPSDHSAEQPGASG